MSEIQYDPACMDCRHDAGKDPAGTTWQCSIHVLAERDWLRAKLANVMVEWEHDVEVLTKERNAALTLSEQREAAYDMMRREFEELLGCGDTMGNDAFERGLARLRDLVAAEARLAEAEKALREIESKTGHFGEAPPPPEWMPMLSLIALVGRIARAALAEEGK